MAKLTAYELRDQLEAQEQEFRDICTGLSAARDKLALKNTNCAIWEDRDADLWKEEFIEAMGGASKRVSGYCRSKITRHFRRRVAMALFDQSVRAAEKAYLASLAGEKPEAHDAWNTFFDGLGRIFGGDWFTSRQIAGEVRNNRIVPPFTADYDKPGSLETSLGRSLAARVRKHRGGRLECRRDSHNGMSLFRVSGAPVAGDTEQSSTQDDTEQERIRIAEVGRNRYVEWTAFVAALREKFGTEFFDVQQILEAGIPLPSNAKPKFLDVVIVRMSGRLGEFSEPYGLCYRKVDETHYEFRVKPL